MCVLTLFHIIINKADNGLYG